MPSEGLSAESDDDSGTEDVDMHSLDTVEADSGDNSVTNLPTQATSPAAPLVVP